jgi:hypothetical protein
MGVEVHAGFMQVIQPITYSATGKQWSVTYGINVDGESGDPQFEVNAAFTDFQLSWKALLDTSMKYEPSVGYYQPPAGPLQLFTAAGVAVAGTAARNSPPPQVATVIRKRTAAVGKAYRGRIFMPGLLDETNVDELGVITPAGVISLQAAANAWLASRVSVLPNLWLFHQKSLVTPTRINALVVQPIVRTQRRRLPRS